MFAQMKNSNTPVEDFEKRNSANPIKLIKKKNKLIPWVFPLLIPLLFPILFLVLMIYSFELAKPPVRHIEVNGQDCHIEYVRERCNSHGGCARHNKAVCP